jgi:Flp pilus assembly protein TadD
MGLTARSQEAYRTAIKLSEDNLRINPHNIDAVSLQALCYAKLGDRARARTLADQTLTTGSITANFRYRAGVALILAGDHAPGVEAVLKALTDGFSRTEAAADYDLRSVLSDTRLRAALGLGPVASRDPP